MYGIASLVDPPRERGRDREHGDAGEHRHGRGRVGVLRRPRPARSSPRAAPRRRERSRAPRGSADELREARGGRRSRPRSSRRRAGPVASTLPASSAANAHAPLGSATVFARSNSRRMACDDLRVGDGDDLVHELLDDRERELAGHRELLAVGDRPRDLDRDALSGCEGAHEVVARLGLDADDPRVRATARRSRWRSR